MILEKENGWYYWNKRPGKSTILKIITGVLAPTAGTVTVMEEFQLFWKLGAGFNPEYSGMENIFLNGTMLGFSEEEINARLDEILSFADIGDFIHQPVKTYSSGMFVRLAFCCGYQHRSGDPGSG